MIVFFISSFFIFKTPIIFINILIFIKYKNKEYRISNINNLITAQDWSYKSLNTHILAGLLEKNSQLNYDEAIDCIKLGLKRYRESIKKAKQLLQETIKKLDIKLIDVENSEVNGKGYLVTGKSGKQYLVTEGLKVYRYPQMSYICIINKGKVGNLNTTDLLISRIYALKNDSVMANSDMIYTLNK